ncbi:hypothetical protein R5R35_004565 [Gryllus longicercus]|uniref:Queuosine 5'-phosphate N-glycosylase/hydrolase n=1 Tax=Gryllus longicercus TaxID=2509291 RepID=A0AAN9W0B9_9ORTH|nr:Queuosine salvage protein [Gryllus bimaculatus]
MALSPKESGAFIAKHATHVFIDREGVQKVASEVYEALKKGALNVQGFSQVELHPKKTDKDAADWIFVVDTLNFCFWKPPNSKEKWETHFRGKTYTGYFALCAAVNRAIEEGVPLTDPKFYSEVTLNDLQKIFRSGTAQPMPLLEERQKCLHEVGKVLLEKYNGSFVNCIRESEGSAQTLLNIITTNFPCFRDEAEFHNQKVALYKRAQILVGDIWACFHGEDLGKFKDIDSLVMFADYRVPQVLVYFGALKYSNELMKKLESDELLPNGSTEEVEIRGCCIEVVELIREEVKKSIAADNKTDLHINSILIDHFLWDYRRKYADTLESIPFHKTPCVYY